MPNSDYIIIHHASERKQLVRTTKHTLIKRLKTHTVSLWFHAQIMLKCQQFSGNLQTMQNPLIHNPSLSTPYDPWTLQIVGPESINFVEDQLYDSDVHQKLPNACR